MPGFLNRAPGEYWRLITRFTLGLIRVASDGGDQYVGLVARPLVLLRLHPPEYELEDGRGSVTWRESRKESSSRATGAIADSCVSRSHGRAPTI